VTIGGIQRELDGPRQLLVWSGVPESLSFGHDRPRSDGHRRDFRERRTMNKEPEHEQNPEHEPSTENMEV
jgi:hypothetical protein